MNVCSLYSVKENVFIPIKMTKIKESKGEDSQITIKIIFSLVENKYSAIIPAH